MSQSPYKGFNRGRMLNLLIEGLDLKSQSPYKGFNSKLGIKVKKGLILESQSPYKGFNRTR